MAGWPVRPLGRSASRRARRPMPAAAPGPRGDGPRETRHHRRLDRDATTSACPPRWPTASAPSSPAGTAPGSGRRPPPPRPADPPVPDQTAAYRLPATTTPRQRPRPARPCARRHHRPSPVTLARSAASRVFWEASTGGDICLHRRPVRRRPRQPRLPDRRRRQPRPRPTRLQVAHQQISRLAKASALGRARLRHTARVVRPASSLGGRPESKRAEHRRRADRAVEPRRRPLTKLFALLVRGCRRRREPSRFISPHNGRLVTRISVASGRPVYCG